jgi:hypothetical protein
MVSIKKVLENCYIVKFNDMWFDLYIDLNKCGKYECFFFDEYIEAKNINELKKLVKNLLIQNA